MHQLTVRGIDDKLNTVVRRLAKRENVSLNQATLKLLQKGAGLSDDADKTDTVGHSLDHLIGSWTPAEADEMDAALKEFDAIDEEVWQ